MSPQVIKGSLPIVISLPHVGTALPDDIAMRMTAAGLNVGDTDWHVQQLWQFARAAGASWLEPHWSRYVVDLNRPPDDAALYPGQLATGLCPRESFAGEPLYVDEGPAPLEVALRRERYWLPYHAALLQLVEETRARHGFAILLDCHSIAAEVPRLFAGRLPDINIGTHDGRSCAPGLSQALMAALAGQQRFSHVLDGRFKGGYITRHYGQPQGGIHAVQIEINQDGYMRAGESYDAALAQPLTAVLRALFDAALTAFR